MKMSLPFRLDATMRTIMNITETERLILRKLSLKDAEFILQLLNEPAFLKYIGDKEVRTLEDAQSYLHNGPLDSYDRLGYGLYMVMIKDKKIPVGICGLKKRASLNIPDLGFAFLKQHRSNGYATESARAVMEYAKEELGIDRIAALTKPQNPASTRVLHKLGFRFEKIINLPEFESESKLFITNM